MKSKVWVTLAKINAALVLLNVLKWGLNIYVFSVLFKYSSKNFNIFEWLFSTKILDTAYTLLVLVAAIIFFFKSKVGWAVLVGASTWLITDLIGLLSGFIENSDLVKFIIVAIIFVLSVAGFIALLTPAVRSRYNIGYTQYVWATAFMLIMFAAKYL
jgi:hypothetical protein